MTDEQSDKKPRKWREWHEREIPVSITGTSTKTGVRIEVKTNQLDTTLAFDYPNSLWATYPKSNKVKLLDNLTYIFTAHLPFLLKGNIRLDYNTGYPQVYSWASQCFMRYLPAYWYLYRGRRGTGVFPLLKTLLNSRATFAQTKDIPPQFPETLQKRLIIPFTFGKDSFLTYYTAIELGLEPMLVYFNEPTETFSRQHKLDLIQAYEKLTGEKVYFVDNPLGNLREYGEGWFGWELALTTWTLLSLPFAYAHKAAYIVFSNEMDVNEFLYDDEGLKVIPDYEQSAQALEELSIMTQSLSEGEVYTTDFLYGLKDLGIIAILKKTHRKEVFPYLMSCWAENESAKEKRWCADCSKCARMYVLMTANGIDPEKEAGFKDNMFALEKAPLFNVFGGRAKGTGWDSFGLNTTEQALAFYLTYLRGNRDPLVVQFSKTEHFGQIQEHFSEIVHEYYSVHDENSIPVQWKKLVTDYYESILKDAERETLGLAP